MLLFFLGVVISHVGVTTSHWCYHFGLVLHFHVGAIPLHIGVASSCWCYYFVHWCYFQVPSSPNNVIVVFALVMFRLVSLISLVFLFPLAMCKSQLGTPNCW